MLIYRTVDHLQYFAKAINICFADESVLLPHMFNKILRPIFLFCPKICCKALLQSLFNHTLRVPTLLYLECGYYKNLNETISFLLVSRYSKWHLYDRNS